MSDPNRTTTEQSPIPVVYAQTPPAKKRRGFAAMDREQVRELARRGGAAAHRAGTAHEFTSDEARAAGRKGGLAAHGNGKSPAEPVGRPTEAARGSTTENVVPSADEHAVTAPS